MPKGKLKVYKVPNKRVIAIIEKTSVTSSIVTVHSQTWRLLKKEVLAFYTTIARQVSIDFVMSPQPSNIDGVYKAGDSPYISVTSKYP